MGTFIDFVFIVETGFLVFLFMDLGGDGRGELRWVCVGSSGDGGRGESRCFLFGVVVVLV